MMMMMMMIIIIIIIIIIETAEPNYRYTAENVSENKSIDCAVVEILTNIRIERNRPVIIRVNETKNIYILL